MGKTLPTRPSQELWSFRDGRVTPLRQVMFAICNCLETKVVCAKYRALQPIANHPLNDHFVLMVNKNIKFDTIKTLRLILVYMCLMKNPELISY